MQAVKYTIPSSPQAAEVAQAYTATHAAIDQGISNTHNEWFRTMDGDVQQSLDGPLLVQVPLVQCSSWCLQVSGVLHPPFGMSCHGMQAGLQWTYVSWVAGTVDWM